MTKSKNLILSVLAILSFSLSSCFHILEELTLKNDGSGQYKVTFDMSEVKSMMEMMKGMVPDSLKTEGEVDGGAASSGQMMEMGQQLTSVTALIQSLGGITNIQEVNDTANYQFSYAFDFANQDALNRALKLIAKEKYQVKAEETYVFSKKKFQRLPVGNIGAELKKQLTESDGGEEEGSMDMLKMFFAEMTYKQVYHFEKNIKTSSNKLSEISDDRRSVSVTLRPFDEEQAKTFPSVATDVKWK